MSNFTRSWLRNSISIKSLLFMKWRRMKWSVRALKRSSVVKKTILIRSKKLSVCQDSITNLLTICKLMKLSSKRVKLSVRWPITWAYLKNKCCQLCTKLRPLVKPKLKLNRRWRNTRELNKKKLKVREAAMLEQLQPQLNHQAQVLPPEKSPNSAQMPASRASTPSPPKRPQTSSVVPTSFKRTLAL